MESPLHVAINGVPHVSLSVFNRALHYGDGLFETLRVVKGKPIALALHLKRLRRGAELLQFSQQAVSSLPSELAHFCHGRETGTLKIILTRNAEQRGYRIPAEFDSQRLLFWYPENNSLSEEHYRVGVSVCRCNTLLPNGGQLAGVKSLNRLPQVLARSEWSDDSIYEGMMFNDQDEVIEGTQSNLFLVIEDKIFTPKVDCFGIEGLMRQQILSQLKRWQVPVVIASLKEPDIHKATAMFLTNSLIGILPVRRYQQSYFSFHPVMQRLQSHYHPQMALPWHV